VVVGILDQVVLLVAQAVLVVEVRQPEVEEVVVLLVKETTVVQQ
jgi:hypothetical protein